MDWSPPLRWLVVPAVIGLFALVGAAISTESRSDFAERNASPAQDDGDNDSDEELPELSGQEIENVPAQPVAPPPDPGGGDTQTEEVLVWYPMDLDIGSDDGDVGVRLGDDRHLLTPRDNSGLVREQLELGPGDEVRLGGDGRLEPRGSDDRVEPGEVVLRPATDGVDLVLEDGARVELRPDRGSFDATEVGPDGSSKVLIPDEDGLIDLGDGITISDPPATGILPRPAPSLLERATSTPWRWIFLAIATLAVVSIAVAVYLHRRRTDEPFGPDFVSRSGVPADRFEEFVAMLLADPDPGRAIRLAFYAAERGIGGLPPRLATETPFEWYHRVVDQRPAVDEPLGSLCDRFATARFAPERPSPADRDAAVAELGTLFEQGSTTPTGGLARSTRSGA